MAAATTTSGGSGALARRLGLGDAVAIGLGSMIGAGVFSAFAPAAAAAGSWLLVGLVIAAVVAFCNATSSGQLAAQYPSAGGAYLYGRERLGEWPGFLAGWSFVIGKTASLAAMALTFAAYAAPAGAERIVAVVAVLAVTAVDLAGVTRTARATRVIVAIVLAVLVLVVVAGVVALGSGTGDPVPAAPVPTADWRGVLESAGILFFAFAGYARIATLGEEVRDPARTIPRAIVLALSGALVVYAVLAVVALAVVGPDRLAVSAAPLVDVATAGGWTWTAPVVRVAAALASLGALLALVAGIGRTALAMAREGDLPRPLAAVSERTRVPARATLVVAAVVVVLVLLVDLRSAIGFSAFGVLLYYGVANVAATTQRPPYRRLPRFVPWLGLVLCLVLVATLPITSIVGGVAVLAVGVLYRLAARPRRRPR